MADATEISRLFAKLASTIRHHSAASTSNDSGNGEVSMAVSSLAASLNPEPTSSSRTGVVDAALSLMCFTAPEVWRSNVKWLVDTIDAVLSCSVSCKVVRFGECDKKGNEFLLIGSSISVPDFEKLIPSCMDILESLEGSGFFHPLLRTFLRVAISTPRYQSLFPISSSCIEGNGFSYGGRRKLGLKFRCLSTDISINSDEVQLRLFLWYLDPQTLKDDILEILADAIHRPYLHLKDEFHSRTAWKFIIICLISSPTVFVQTRLLLHNWFLVTGLISVLELQIAVISSALDILARPMAWGLTFQMGLNLPFSHAYFHHKHHDLLTILRGPISNQNFLELVHLIGLIDAPNANQLKLHVSHYTSIKENMREKSTSIDPNSTWTMLMCFPCWFYFATVLLFRRKDSGGFVLPVFLPEKGHIDVRNESKLYQSAVSYLALILDPSDHASQAFLVDCINKMTRSWHEQVKAGYTSQQAQSSQTHVKVSFQHSKKLRTRKIAREKLQMTRCEPNNSTTKLWLQQFHRYFAYQNSDLAAPEVNSRDSSHTCGNLVVTKIILGILLASPHYLDEEDCQLLLHYAATGEIIVEDIQFDRIRCVSSGSCIDYGFSPDASNTMNWSMGASLTLNLLDIVEEMTCMFFETEDARLDYISLIKSKTVGYLVRCTSNILKSKQGIGVEVVQTDLLKRLVRWKKQGREVFEGCKNLDDVIQALIEISKLLISHCDDNRYWKMQWQFDGTQKAPVV